MTTEATDDEHEDTIMHYYGDIYYALEAFLEPFVDNGTWMPASPDAVFKDIRESGSRLPPDIADQLYEAGESGMGYCIFTIVFDDGSRQAYATGNAVDFIDYPTNRGPQNVTAVLPHKGREDPVRREGGANFLWCLYDGE